VKEIQNFYRFLKTLLSSPCSLLCRFASSSCCYLDSCNHPVVFSDWLHRLTLFYLYPTSKMPTIVARRCVGEEFRGKLGEPGLVIARSRPFIYRRRAKLICLTFLPLPIGSKSVTKCYCEMKRDNDREINGL